MIVKHATHVFTLLKKKKKYFDYLELEKHYRKPNSIVFLSNILGLI